MPRPLVVTAAPGSGSRSAGRSPGWWGGRSPGGARSGPAPRSPLATVADVVLTKPARARQLAKTLGRILSGEVPQPRFAPASTAPPSGRVTLPLRILLVEDNFVNQRVASLMLRRLGYAADAV